uniref:Zinc finger protein RFP-like n=2 Tax=Varanus komodoensis TaxID=61221 RepID=A0A8D2IRR9_VARKO
MCPQCRAPFRPGGAKPNRQLANLVELLKELQESKRAAGGGGVCERHREPLKLFCRDDAAAICVVCDRSKEHREHGVIPLEEAVQECKEKIQAQMTSLEKERENLKNQKLAEELRSQESLKLLGEEKQKINSAFEQMHTFLEEERSLCLAQLNVLEKTVEKRQEENSTRLVEKISQLGDLIAEMEGKLQQSANEFLQDFNKILNRSQEEQAGQAPDPSPRLDGRVAQCCQMNRALENSLAKCRDILELVLNTAFWEQASQKAVDVTLDPITAHPDLILSGDLKCVKWEGIGLDLPDNPERFDETCSVLGCERFSSGEHWWEVEVDGRIWETWCSGKATEVMWAVGVARESVARKGKINHYPNENIWAVGKAMSNLFLSCKFWAFTSPGWTPLTLRNELRMIRVYLDYEKGRVEFFDADTQDVIFTFSTSFMGESIRPYFWVNPGVRMKCRDMRSTPAPSLCLS